MTKQISMMIFIILIIVGCGGNVEEPDPSRPSPTTNSPEVLPVIPNPAEQPATVTNVPTSIPVPTIDVSFLHSQWPLYAILAQAQGYENNNPYDRENCEHPEYDCLYADHVAAQNAYNQLIVALAQEAIEEYSVYGELGFDTAFLATVTKRIIAHESQFVADASSTVDGYEGFAVGLMGISEYAVNEIYSEQEAKDINRTDAQENIETGLSYLAGMLEVVTKQDANNVWRTPAIEQLKFALALYNAGPNSGILELRINSADPTQWNSIAESAPVQTQLYIRTIFNFEGNPAE